MLWALCLLTLGINIPSTLVEAPVGFAATMSRVEAGALVPIPTCDHAKSKQLNRRKPAKRCLLFIFIFFLIRVHEYEYTQSSELQLIRERNIDRKRNLSANYIRLKDLIFFFVNNNMGCSCDLDFRGCLSNKYFDYKMLLKFFLIHF